MRHILLSLLFTVSASAQTLEQLASIRIDEQPMSARAAAMGGASDALTPDGSDLAANPALIASLRRPVFSLSTAETTFDVVNYRIDGFLVVEFLEPHSQQALAHVSAAIPWRGAVIGLYARGEPRIAYRTLSGGNSGPLVFETCVDCEYAVFSGPTAWDRHERRYGLTAAFERGSLSFGAGAELQELDETYQFLRVQFAAIPLSPVEHVTHRTKGRKIVPNAGLRWRVAPRIAVAAAYNGGTSRERTADVCNVDLMFPGCRSQLVQLGSDEVRTPDAYRASLTVAPAERLTVTAEAVRRNYSKSTDANEQLWGIESLRYRDTTDLHAGVEYRLPRVPVSLRAGWQRQPAKVGGFDSLGLQDQTVEHRTYGAGFELVGARVDVAYDDADAPALRRAVIGVTLGIH